MPIGNRYGNEFQQHGGQYNYKYSDFLLAMGALIDACLSNQQKTLREICYHTMKFENIDNDEDGYI